MEDFLIIKELEKKFDRSFVKTDSQSIIGYKSLNHTQYSIDENNNLIGLSLSELKLKIVPFLIVKPPDILEGTSDKSEVIDIWTTKIVKSLEYLNLSNNQLTDISTLRNLTNLKYLNLSNNRLSDLSDYINTLKNFKSLRYLNLSNNGIKNIENLKLLTNLEYLLLRHNQIRDLSPLIENKKLKLLFISDNNIVKIPEKLYLKFYEQKGISDIQIIYELKIDSVLEQNFEAAANYRDSEKKLLDGENIIPISSNHTIQFSFYNNPLESPPLEIVKQGKESIVNWFSANKKALNEVKVILIGDAKAGKTSLLRRLQNNQYNPNEEQTDGIIIESFEFKNLKTFKDQKKLHGIKAYFWDFGGQEIMSSTHQFFMTNRSVYILVLEARKDQNADLQVKDWLKRIQTFGGNSQVIVVVNKIELNESFGLNTYELKNEFPQIKDFYKISCEKNIAINDLKTCLEEYIPRAELFKTQIDERWFPIKDKLQEITSEKQYITKRDFISICNKNNLLEDVDKNQAIEFLNDLGVVLHFSDLRMSDYFVLDPYWVTTGVYRIITSQFAAKKKGEILFSDLDYIVNKEKPKEGAFINKKQKDLTYSSNELLYLSEIMAQFKLCYFSENREKILIPDLLDKETPAKEVEAFVNETNTLNIIYKYDYFPNAIIHFFMVELKRDINFVWRTGVILNSKSSIEAQALIIATDNKIKISVIGEHRDKRDYLSVIRFFLDNINSKYHLKPKILIPLGSNDNSIEYIALSNMDKEGVIIYKDFITNIEYNVSELLNGIIGLEILQEQGQIINKMYLGSIDQLNDLSKKMTSEFDKVHFKLDSQENIMLKLEVKLDNYSNDLKKKLESKGEDFETIENLIFELHHEMKDGFLETLNQTFDYIDINSEEIKEIVEEKYRLIFDEIRKGSNSQAKIKFVIPLLKILDLSGVPVSGAIEIILKAIDVRFEGEHKLKKMIKKTFNKGD